MIRQELMAAHDGTSLYYEVSGRPLGDGPTAVLCDGIGCDGFVWRYIAPWLASRAHIVHPHYRGHGCSGRAAGEGGYTIETLVADMDSVLSREGVGDVVIFGHSMGVQVALEAAAQFDPDRVKGLVLMCGSYGRPLDTFRDSSVAAQWLPLVRTLVARFGGRVAPVIQRLTPTRIGWWVAAATEVDSSRITREDFAPYLEHLAAMDPNVFLETLAHAAAHTTEHRLPEIAAPALVVGAEKDHFTPYWVSEVMADRLPNAELLCVHEGTHSAPIEQPQRIEYALERFCRLHGLWPQSPQSSVAPPLAR